jgi:hypothetical protein
VGRVFERRLCSRDQIEAQIEGDFSEVNIDVQDSREDSIR